MSGFEYFLTIVQLNCPVDMRSMLSCTSGADDRSNEMFIVGVVMLVSLLVCLC